MKVSGEFEPKVSKVLFYVANDSAMIIRIITLLFSFASILTPCLSQDSKPVSVIFDTDMGPDYDDVGAITLLHALADSNKVKIIGTIASTRYEGVAAILNLFNTYFGRPGLPVGVPRDNAVDTKDWQGWSDSLRARYPHTLKTNAAAKDAVTLYRQLLAGEPDNSVTIVTVGFLTNLAALLSSAKDQFSDLDGIALVKKKAKLLVSMAGHFPAGREFNIHKDASSSITVFDKWPTPVILSGFEIGVKIKTGLPLLNNAGIRNNPAKDVYAISIPKSAQDSLGRMSWDQTAVMVAINGHEPYYDLERGTMIVAPDGSNTWEKSGKRHQILVEKASPEVVKTYIDKLMQHQPVKNK